MRSPKDQGNNNTDTSGNQIIALSFMSKTSGKWLLISNGKHTAIWDIKIVFQHLADDADFISLYRLYVELIFRLRHRENFRQTKKCQKYGLLP